MSDSCTNLTAITDPGLQCSYVRESCQLGSVIPYASLIYCYISSTFLRVLVISIIVMLIFAAMGVAAFDYLSPNLTHLAEISGLSQSLMGVTVLAFGNGSVDVFGALVALKSGEGGMAFGEIMGGALFVCTVVIGSMAVIKPFQVDPHCTLRDVSVLTLSIAFTMFIVSDGIVTLGEALLGLCFYSAYAVFVVHQQLNSTARHRRAKADDVMPIPDIEEPESPFRSRSSSISSLNAPFTPLRPSLYSAVDMSWKVQQILDDMSSRSASPQPSSSGGDPPGVTRRLSAPDVVAPPESDYSIKVRLQPPTSQSACTSPELQPTHFARPNVGEEPSSQPSASLMPTNKASLDQLPKLDTGNSIEHRRAAPEPHSRRRELQAGTQLQPHLQNQLLHIPPSGYPNERNSGSSRASTPTSHSQHNSSHHHVRWDVDQNKSGYKDFSVRHLIDQLLESHRELSAAPVLNPAADGGHGSGTTTHSNSCASSLSGHNDDISTIEITGGDISLDAVDDQGWRQYLFPSLTNWSEYTWAHRIMTVIAFPVMSLLSWSIPLSSKSKTRRRIYIYSVGVPMVFPMLMPNVTYSMRVILAQVGCVAAALFWWGKLHRPLPPVMVIAATGFFMGILWVLVLATELVAILTVLGTVCHVSQTMLGLTVFALGDSLGDFVSNITVARIGFPTMAFSACFGGPIFTLLVGVSGASLVTMLSQRQLQLEVPVRPSLLFSGVGLLLALLMLGISLYCNSFHTTKTLGIQLICMWFLTVIGSMLFS